jgi:hypothetical protein
MRSNSQKRLPSETRGQVLRPSSEQDRIDLALQKMCRRLNKVITVERINLWHEDLAPYPVEGIEYAFDCWGANAKALPVLADIVGMLQTWTIPNAGERDEPGCEKCKDGFIVTNPEKSVADWVVTPCECIRDRSLRNREQRDPNPLTQEEVVALAQRLRDVSGTQPNRFPNGNPRMNRPLTQARALLNI